MLAEGLAAMRQARRRSFQVDGQQVIVQCNPARAKSATAKLDPASLAARPCFLCRDSLPKSQCAIVYRKDWLILCNPAPLVEPHFTISSIMHQPQRLSAAARAMLELARDLNGAYTVFYNGPASGASAPDDLHLVAGQVASVPYERQMDRRLLCGRDPLVESWYRWSVGDVRVGVSLPGRRPCVLMLSRSKQALLARLNGLLSALGAIHPATPEPMLNLFVNYADECWTVWLFPRAAHRPSVYGHEPGRFLISPGAIDVAGILITPRVEDIEAIDEGLIRSIYSEVLLGEEAMAKLREALV